MGTKTNYSRRSIDLDAVQKIRRRPTVKNQAKLTRPQKLSPRFSAWSAEVTNRWFSSSSTTTRSSSTKAFPKAYPKKLVHFFQNLERKGIKLHVKINDNRQTMLSVQWEPNQTKVSLHRMFLTAPQNIMQALACYIKREHKAISPDIKAFIEARRLELDYSHIIDRDTLDTKGSAFDLMKIYRKLNKTYFKNSLDLGITWFGSSFIRNRSRCSLGLYYDTLKLIKIHRLLDNPLVPYFVIEFVVFHEMLHAVCPAYIDERGIHRAHGAEFKKHEESFYCYKEATDWIRKHQMNFFLFRGRSNGRA